MQGGVVPMTTLGPAIDALLAATSASPPPAASTAP
jgi:hypothetical protein